jgi:hypothetical protein
MKTHRAAHSGIIDPESIDEYIGAGGYEAWKKPSPRRNPCRS